MNTRNDRATWIKGCTAKCSIPPKMRLQPPRLILLGAPGVGKSLQAELLCSGLQICHLAMNDVLRTARFLPEEERTPAMAEALTFMKRGEPVPEATISNLIHERMVCLRCRGGFLLDGFPRTAPQAEDLDRFLDHESIRLDAVLNYTLPFNFIITRLCGKRTCQECHAVFHVESHPPQSADVCDYCGGILTQQEDDLPEAVEARLLDYEKAIKPLLKHYVNHGLLRTISAEGTPERVYARTLAILDN